MRHLFATVTFAAVLLAAVPATAQQRLALDQYMDMESVSNPQISPDGARIVYTRGWIDKRNDSPQVVAADHGL